MEKIKILIVIGQLDIGGTELHILNIFKRFDKHRFDVYVYPIKKGGVLENNFRNENICVIGKRFPKIGKLNIIFVIIELLILSVRIKPNIHHFFLPEAYIIGAFCSFFTRKTKRIMSRRSLNFYQKKYPLINALEKWLHKKMDVILGNSRAVCEQLMDEAVPDDKLQLLYNCVDIKKFDSDHHAYGSVIKERFGNPDIILLCVANLIPYKGHEDLLQGLALIKNKINKKWCLLLVGRDDGHGKYLKSLTKKLKLEKNVWFLNEVYDIPALIKNSDMGLLCSHEEGFSNSILEYMAGGLPTVVTDAGGNSEAVVDGVTGRIVPIAEPNELGQAILELVNNPIRRRQMGLASRERVEQFFSFQACVAAYEQLYSKLLSDKL